MITEALGVSVKMANDNHQSNMRFEAFVQEVRVYFCRK